MRKALGIALLLLAAVQFANAQTGGAPTSQMKVAVTAERVNLREKPSTDAPISATVVKGTELAVLAIDGAWYAVIDPATGKSGFVHNLTVKVISGTAPAPAGAAPPSAPGLKPTKPAPAQPARPPVVRQPSAPKDYSQSFSMIIGRVGAFLPADSDFKTIYGTGMVFGGEIRIGPKRPGGPRLVGWIEGNTRQRTGKLTFTGEETKVTVTAAEGGVLYRVKPGRMSPYLGAGVGYFMFKENNEPLGEAKQNKVGFSGIGGVSFMAGTRFVIDLRLKYTMVSMAPAGVSVKVGGITAGAGIGLLF